MTENQLSLFKKITELRLLGMNFQQISDELNKLQIPPTRGKVGEFNNRKVWSNYMKIGRNLNKNDIYHPPDLDDVDIEWE